MSKESEQSQKRPGDPTTEEERNALIQELRAFINKQKTPPAVAVQEFLSYAMHIFATMNRGYTEEQFEDGLKTLLAAAADWSRYEYKRIKTIKSN